MKIIDLLNKIANGEEIPEKIRFENYIYIWRNIQKDYFCEQINHSLESIIGEYLFENLNLEVEIIEEEPKPLTKQYVEALGYACGEIQKSFTNGWNKSLKNKPFKEDKKIEKLEVIGWNDCIHEVTHTEKRIFIEINKTQSKLNEIIDYLMEEK